MFNQDDVQFKILIEAAQALKELEHLRTDAVTLQSVFDEVSRKTEETADKMGVEFMTMEKQFKDVIHLAEQMRKTLADMGEEQAEQMLASNPILSMFSDVQSPFSTIQDATGWTEVNAIRKEVLKGKIEEIKLAERIANEMNKQSQAEAEIAEKRKENLNLAEQELQAVEKEGEALASQLENYGQVQRTVQETASYLRSFAGTQQGQSILTKFIGDYQQSRDAVERIASIKEAIVSLSKATGASFSQSGQFIKEQFGQIPYISNQVGAAVSQLGSSFEATGKKAQTAFEKVFTALNTARIALGALISMLLFQGLQAITGTFGEALKQAREFEATLYRIANAEKQLSMAGIEVSTKELKKGIEDIKDALPIFSKEDIAQLIGGIATTTKELGFTGQEILKLGAAVAILNINSTEAETLLQTMGKVANSLVSPTAKSIGNLGLSFGKAKIEAKAFEMQILSAGETFADLTEKEKSQVKFEIVLETAGIDGVEDLEKLRDIIKEAGGDFAALDKYLQSNDAKLASNKAAWNDLLTTVGQLILPFLPLLTGFFQLINDGFTGTKIVIIEAITLFSMLGAVIGALLTGQVEILTKLPEIADKVRGDLVNRFFKEMPDDAPKFLNKYWDLIKEDAETATNAIKDMYDAAADEEEALKALEDLDQKIKDILLDAQHAQEDLDINLEQKQEDLDLEYIRKADDAAIDHAHKLEDINQDTLDKIEDAKRKAREEEEKREQDLLQKLKELRERYLLDLEDALHERDARAVLRLMKEYDLDKRNILDRAALDESQRKDDLAAELQNIEEERRRRIESENIEYQRKLADLDTSKAREQEALKVWYQREQEDIKRNIQQKLESLLAGYITEEKLHEEHQGKIYAILAKYFGKDMALMGNLTAFMAQQFAQIQAMAGYASALGSLGGGVGGGGFTQLLSQGGSGSHNTGSSGRPGRRRMASGGQFVATRPTTLDVGEGGMPELVSVIPLSKLLGGSLGTNGSGGSGGLNGSIEVAVTLSPDLEGRIIESAMDGVGEVIGKVNRSK